VTVKPETQKERWIKYGGNVVLASVVVVVLAVVVVWLAQEANARVDTTTAGLYSLKPQTINIISKNDQPIKIVSLYTRVKRQNTNVIAGQEDTFDYITPVADLLEEYKRKGKNIDVEVIDPNEQPTKVDQLIRDVTEKYGGEVEKYKTVIADYPEVYNKINGIITEEQQKLKTLPSMQKLETAKPEELKGQEWLEGFSQTMGSVGDLSKMVVESRESIERILKQKIPDYKGAVDSIQSGMTLMSQLAGGLSEAFKKAKDVEKYPQDVRQYMEQAIPRFDEIKNLADGLEKRIEELGELKLDTLKQSLDQEDTILVMGPNDVRILPRSKIWQTVEREQLLTPDQKPRPRFAAEQQITSAILAVTSNQKQKVVFVRPGGPPMTTGNPFMGIGQFYILAERLRDYNFDVLEKDISGMWAMQSQMRGMPGAPEPSDEEIKDAIWVVVGMNAGGGPMQQPAPIGPKLQEHLNRGGTALVLADLRGDNMQQALDEWGVKIRTDAMAVHEPVEGVPATGDIIADAQRVPYIFIINEYGNHLLAKPLRSLDGLILPIIPVSVEKKQGYKAEPLIPVPQVQRIWGETNVESLEEGVKYDAGIDIAPPLFGGAVVEKEGEGGGRLVVIGSVAFASNRIAGLADDRSRRAVLRFPGNQELFMNSVFWLAKMEPMIAISPTAMEVNRITPMSTGAHNFWRVGVVLVMLPLAVVFAGAAMYMKRRD
jgi:hypothetical protein